VIEWTVTNIGPGALRIELRIKLRIELRIE
jgi:hypothetical protein